MTVRFTFHCPEAQGPDADSLDAGSLLEIATAAERVGFDGISLSEHPAPGARWLSAGGHQTLDPLVTLGYIAGATHRIRLITNLVVAPYRNPFLLAKASATVDRLSGGRLTLGLGTGYQKTEFYALGVDMEERNNLFDEALDVLPMHWRGEPFSYAGRHFDAREVIARPRPVQNPIPIWIGGNSKLSRRRIAERAQGWMPMSGPAELSATTRTPPLGSLPELADMIAELRDAAAARGRSDLIDVTYSYPDRSIASPSQDADRHREALADIERVGVTWVIISSGAQEATRTLDFLQEFGATYLAL
jgi:probable F420-dependent oxidoreductase